MLHSAILTHEHIVNTATLFCLSISFSHSVVQYSDTVLVLHSAILIHEHIVNTATLFCLSISFSHSVVQYSDTVLVLHSAILIHLHIVSSPETKSQLTRNLVGNIGATCRSKIAKIVLI